MPASASDGFSSKYAMNYNAAPQKNESNGRETEKEMPVASEGYAEAEKPSASQLPPSGAQAKQINRIPSSNPTSNMAAIQGRFSQVNSNTSFSNQGSMMPPRLQTSINSGDIQNNSMMQQSQTGDEPSKVPSFKGEQPAPQFDQGYQRANAQHALPQGPQYITNIYNSINANNITVNSTHAPQAAQDPDLVKKMTGADQLYQQLFYPQQQ